MIKKYSKLLLITLLVVVVGNLLISQGALAQSGIIGNLKLTRVAADLPETDDPISVVALIIKGALGLVAIIFFVLIVVAGFRWMTAGGNEETVGKAKKNIGNAVIGVVVILFAYLITSFVFNILLDK